MEQTIIPKDDGKGFILAFEGGDIEHTNPVDYYSKRQKESNKMRNKVLLFAVDAEKARHVPASFYEEKAEESWAAIKTKIDAAEVPETLLAVLKAGSKQEQEQLAKKSEFNALQFAAFLFKAYADLGFAFSNYVTEQLPKNVDPAEMPLFAQVKDDGTVLKTGETTLTDGQIKAAINFRRVVIAKFLDRGSEWHCFFTVYRSLRGEESWRGGQPHFHYISDKWGHTRDEVVAMFKGDHYPVTSVHIPYHES